MASMKECRKNESGHIMGTEESFYRAPHRSVKVSNYFDIYDYLFSKYVGRDVTFVEIGVLGGGSLFMWRDYFGESARIVGIDLNPESLRWKEFGFEIFIGDQSDPAFWSSLGETLGEVDVILDDGGHTYLQQVTTVIEGGKLVKENGVIVIEDTHTSYQSGYGPARYSFLSWAKKQIDEIQDGAPLLSGSVHKEFWSIGFYQGMVTFKKRSRDEKPNKVIDNGKEHKLILDHRYHNDKVVYAMDKLAYRFEKLKNVPGAEAGYKAIRRFVLSWTKLFSPERKLLKALFQKPW